MVSAGPLGVELRARESLLLLSAVVALSGACLLGSSGLVYLSKRMVIGIAETDLARRLTDVVRIAMRLPDPRAPQASHVYRHESGVGAFDEALLFVVEDGALTASATLGTGESDAVAARFATARRAAEKCRGARGPAAFDGPGSGDEEEE